MSSASSAGTPRSGGTSRPSHTPDGVGFWVVSRHADVRAAAADADTFSSERATGPGRRRHDHPGPALRVRGRRAAQHDGRPPASADPPLLTPAVAPRALALMEAELRTRTAAILDAVADEAGATSCRRGGRRAAPAGHASADGRARRGPPRPHGWTNATLTYDDRELGRRPTTRCEQAAAAMAAYGDELIAAQAAPGGDDILADGRPRRGSRARTVGQRRCRTSNCSMFFNLLVAAGSETTRNAIALGHGRADRAPRAVRRARADRPLLDGAAEEILRWSSPTLYNRRTATRRRRARRQRDPGRRQGRRCGGRRPTATRPSSTTRSASTSAATRTRISPSATGATSAWARTWPASRSGSCSRSCSTRSTVFALDGPIAGSGRTSTPASPRCR